MLSIVEWSKFSVLHLPHKWAIVRRSRGIWENLRHTTIADRALRFESLFDCLFVLGLEIFYYDFEKD